CELQDTLIIDTSNAHAAPGPSRGYACLRVAFPSIGPHPLEGEIRGWGFAGDSTRLRPPKCRPRVRRSRPVRRVTSLLSPLVSVSSPASTNAAAGGFIHLAARGAWRGRCPAWSRVRRPPCDRRRLSRDTREHGQDSTGGE